MVPLNPPALSPALASRRGLPSRALILGILNVTPDSFFDGGRTLSLPSALAHAERLVHEGADALDIGGESTRPGSVGVSLQEELARVIPVVEQVRSRFPDLFLSVDTSKAEVARRAIAAGASMINDVTALRGDAAMVEVLAETQTPVILMHMQGTPQTMQVNPSYTDVVKEVTSFFEERLRLAERRGVLRKNIWLDPGIGFGKTFEHNLTLLRHLDRFVSLGRPLVVGISRKSFLGRLLGGAGPEDRLEASLAAGAWAVLRGARMLRVHDVLATRRMLQTLTAFVEPLADRSSWIS